MADERPAQDRLPLSQRNPVRFVNALISFRGPPPLFSAFALLTLTGFPLALNFIASGEWLVCPATHVGSSNKRTRSPPAS